MTIHLIKGTASPTVIPIEVGCHFIDTVNKKSYISVGTGSISDWKETAGGGGGPGGAVDSVFGRVGTVTAQAGDYTAAQVGAYTTAQVDTALAGKVSGNAPITGGTKTKITYDSKGLVIAGANLVGSDIPAFTGATASTIGSFGGVPQPIAGDDIKFLRGDGTWASAASGSVASVNGRTGAVVLTSADVNLGNVDNTSDLNKPISYATQTALDGKIAANAAITGGTFTKITFDGKGLVTAGANLAAGDLPLFIGATGSSSGTPGAVPAPTVGQTSLFLRSDGTWAAAGGGGGAVDSVNGRTGAVVLTKSDVGLANVDNTSDANKPISSATQTALNNKVTANSAITAGTATKITYDAKGLVTAGGTLLGTDLPVFTGSLSPGSPGTQGSVPAPNDTDALKFLRGDGTWAAVTAGVSSVNGQTGAVTLTKNDVGLGNADNTSDANKPISSATQTALDAKVTGNAAITAGTATKITYDAKGLVTAGTSLDVSDIPAFTPASSGSGGSLGGVPVSSAGDQGKFLRADGTWQTVSGGGGTPGGANTNVQFNDNGSFGGTAGLTWDTLTNQLVVTGSNSIVTDPSFTVRGSSLTTVFQVRNTGLITGPTLDTGTANNTVRIGVATASTVNLNDSVAIGRAAGVGTGTGTASSNVFIGATSGNKITTGARNNAIGIASLNALTSGADNTVIGHNALRTITTFSGCTAVGSGALGLTTGGTNTAVGSSAGAANIDGTGNTFLGATCANAVQYVNNCVYLGANIVATNGTAGVKTNLEIVIGTGATGRGSGTTTIGTASNTNTQMWGDLFLIGNGKGIRLVSPNGSITKTITIDNTGAIALL